MSGGLRHSLRVAGALMRTSWMTGMQYRADFLADIGTGFVRTAATVAPLFLVYSRTDEIAGWPFADAALVMALFLLMEGLVGGLVEPNLGMVVEAIREGTLDLVLMKPADAQLLVSARTVAPARVWDVLAALAFGAWALAQRDAPPSPADIAVAAALLGAGLVSLYALWLLAICTSFWFVRVDNLRFLLWSATDAGQWPIPVFRGWLRFVLTWVVPVAVVTSFPAMALAGRWDGHLVLTGMAIAALFTVVSRVAWTRSLRAYTSASS